MSVAIALVAFLVGILVGWLGTFYLRRKMDEEMGYGHIKDKW